MTELSSLTVVKRGIGGQQISEMLSRFEEDAFSQRPRAISYRDSSMTLCEQSGKASNPRWREYGKIIQRWLK